GRAGGGGLAVYSGGGALRHASHTQRAGPATARDRTAGAEATAGTPAGRRLADSHLASPTAMHAVGPPPFPRWPQAMSGGWRRASELSAGRAECRGRTGGKRKTAGPPTAREVPACPTLGAMTRGWDKELRARGYRVTPQRQLVLEAVTKLEHASPEEIWADVQQTASGVNISTIYRALELLEQLGLVTHTHLGHGAP